MTLSKRLSFGPERVSGGAGAAPRPGEVARGEGWFLMREEDDLVLRYLTGRNPEVEAAMVVTEDEADRLRAGEASVLDLLEARPDD